VISATGEHLVAAQFPATAAGYRALAGFITCHGPLLRAGVEGTNSYGANVARHLRGEGLDVVEVIRPARQVRRMRGKSDEIDAYAAAHIALADNDSVTPKAAAGPVEAIRVIHAARRSAIKARTEAIQQIKSLLVTAPEPIRAEYRPLSVGRLVSRLAASRPHSGDDETAASTRVALKRLAVRYQRLDEEVGGHEDDLTRRVHAANPALTQATGVGTITAAQLLVTAGDNPDRIGSEAAFAMLCGAAPIPASSGKTNRYRLNRGGDRAANCALHQIAISRLATDPATQAYAAKRTADGKTNKDILRCLKRAIAREIYHMITSPKPAEDSIDLRPAREQLGITMAHVAAALDCSIAKVSRLERGHIANINFLHQYREWLTGQKLCQAA
jgi:transposase